MLIVIGCTFPSLFFFWRQFDAHSVLRPFFLLLSYIQRKADGTTATVSTTPLCLAAQLHFGNTKRTIGVIRVLLAAGGLIGTTDSSGCSALYYAVAWGSAATVQVLLQHAAASSPSWLTRMLNATQTITHAAEADARAQILLLDVAEAESDSEGTRMT